MKDAAPIKLLSSKDGGNWDPQTKASLEKLLNKNSFKNKLVILDFDGTTVSRDIGDATFGYLVGEKKLKINEQIKSISPSFVYDGKKIDVATGTSLVDYYEKYPEATAHHTSDDTPYSNAYAWLVQIMSGFSPADIIKATEMAYSDGIAEKDSISKTGDESLVDGLGGYRRPFFHPEMVNLIGELVTHGYDVYFVTASNVWSVRWMVLNPLNKKLKEQFGTNIQVSPDRVIGISTQLIDKRDGKLYLDAYLVKENKLYATLNQDELKNYELTAQIAYPLTAYYGKISAIQKYISQSIPFLVAGDSPGDFPMLKYSENKLWIARLEKEDYQKMISALIKADPKKKWLIQPALYKKLPGFVPSNPEAKKKLIKFVSK